MKNKQRYITAGVTIAAAVATAHLMQSKGGSAQTTASVSPLSVAAEASAVQVAKPAPVQPLNEVTVAAVQADPVEQVEDSASDVAFSSELPRPPQDVLMPAPLPATGAGLQDRMTATAVPEIEGLPDEPARNEFGLTCGPILSASAGESGMARLTLTAPCRGDQRVTVHHGDIVFTDQVDHLGTYRVEIPVLASDASFSIVFPDGHESTAQVEVPSVNDLERVALLFQGDAGLQIHALEFGADYGEEGHVWSGAPRGVEQAEIAGGGFMTVLGNAEQKDPLLAEVYTFPANTRDRDGVVRLSVEAEVTAYNCETEVAGQIIEPDAEGNPKAVSMTVSMPECSAIGEYLVLKNLLRDLRIASN